MEGSTASVTTDVANCEDVRECPDSTESPTASQVPSNSERKVLTCSAEEWEHLCTKRWLCAQWFRCDFILGEEFDIELEGEYATVQIVQVIRRLSWGTRLAVNLLSINGIVTPEGAALAEVIDPSPDSQAVTITETGAVVGMNKSELKS